MTSEEVLDRILLPRPNGSEALADVAQYLSQSLAASGAEVVHQPFAATPHGFALVWGSTAVLMLAWTSAVVLRRYALALVPLLLVPLLLLAEFEALWSPLSGLLPATEENILGTFPGRAGGPLLVFCAHYDTTTHFGDHRDWGRWGWRLGPALGIAFALTLGGLVLERGFGRPLPRWVSLPASGVVWVPFAAMLWFHVAGPWLRTPSPGALDNGGSVTALLRLAERLDERRDASSTVTIAFVAAEEERALGSRTTARALDRSAPVAIYNLESIGARGRLAYVPEDGFELRRFHSPHWLVELVDAAGRELGRPPLPPLPLPMGTLTDGRSFLAEGLPALTLRATVDGSFPTRLHSEHDSRDRLSVTALEETVDLLEALVRLVDREPERIRRLDTGESPAIDTPTASPAPRAFRTRATQPASGSPASVGTSMRAPLHSDASSTASRADRAPLVIR